MARSERRSARKQTALARLRGTWAKVKTPIIVAVAGAIVSAWVIPAVTRQWQDRQKARELKAALVTKIGVDATDALVRSDFVDYGRFGGVKLPNGALPFADDQFNDLDLNWRENSEEIEATIAAYFPKLQPEWHAYAALVRNTYFLLKPRVNLRAETVDTLVGLRLATPPEARLVGKPFTDRPADHERNAYYYISVRLLDAKDTIIAEVLRAHVAGYSQGPVDFLHDLLPFL